MWNWKNDVDNKNGQPYSRYIASWIDVGGQLKTLENIGEFTTWLDRLGVEKADINNIVQMATNGKMEIESSARRFLQRNTNNEKESD